MKPSALHTPLKERHATWDSSIFPTAQAKLPRHCAPSDAAQAKELLPAVEDAYKQVADAIAMFR